MNYDVAIVGGGVIGAAIARELSRYRLRLILLEKECEVGFGTSKANSGIIHAGHHGPVDTLKGRLEWEGNRMWGPLAHELGVGIKDVGELTVAFDAEEQAVLRSLLRRAQSKGVCGVELWERERALHEEPNLSTNIVEALFAPTTAVVNPYEACFALAESARRNGVNVSTGNEVVGISRRTSGLWLKTSRGPLHSRFVVNAAGLFADRLAHMAGAEPFDIRPRKGEEYLLDKRLEGLVSRLIMPCPTPTSKGILVIPTFDGPIMVGPTAHDVDDKHDLATTAHGSDEVFAGARRLVPGISDGDCIAQFAGLRAVATGEDFIIGPTRVRGFINVAGIQSPGLTAAPAIAEMTAEILEREGLALDGNPQFRPELEPPLRFAGLGTSEQKRLARSEPGFGRIVCRCELVTEAELLAAIRRGARTLDGLKFRTRAGMGRCQGGFCGLRCIQLLASELGISLSKVTKRGHGSWVLTERVEQS